MRLGATLSEQHFHVFLTAQMKGWPRRQIMIPVAIFAFLVGAVLAWAFRVWILVPITLLTTIAAFTIELALGADFSTVVGHSLLIGLAPQLGYGFGLFVRHTLLVLRSPPLPQSSASVAMLHKQRSVDQ